MQEGDCILTRPSESHVHHDLEGAAPELDRMIKLPTSPPIPGSSAEGCQSNLHKRCERNDM